MSTTSSTVKPISFAPAPAPPPVPPCPCCPPFAASSALPSSRMIVEPVVVPASGDGVGERGGRPSARHPSTTVTSVPRTFTSPATTGGAPGIRVVGRRGRISRTWSTSAAHTNVPTRNTSRRARTKLPSVIGCEEAKILQGVALSKQICVGGRFRQRRTQVIEPFGHHGDRLIGHRMDERQRRRMQQLARRERLESLCFHPRGRGHAPAATERVLAVPDDRATHVRQV